MNEPIIGLIGIVIGIALTEYFRKRRRIDDYSKIIFEKRLSIYEDLYRMISEGNEVISEKINEGETYEKMHELVSCIIHNIIEFNERNEFYIDDNIMMHSFTLFMGAEDIVSLEGEKKKEERKNLALNVKNTKEMLKDEAGIGRMDKSIKKMTKSKPNSPVIEYYKSELKKLEKLQK